MFLTGGASGSESRGVKDKYLSTALSAAEMIRKGCTACYDLSAEFPRWGVPTATQACEPL